MTRHAVKKKFMTDKPARAGRDYALPALTFEEAARVLGVDVVAFKLWVMERVCPGPDRWSGWSSGDRPIPEVLIRLYLHDKLSPSDTVARPVLSSPQTFAGGAPDDAREIPDQSPLRIEAPTTPEHQRREREAYRPSVAPRRERRKSAGSP